MRSPARLVTGTAVAAFTAAALGLCAAAPSAYADEPGPLEITPANAAPGTTVTVNTKACGSDTGATGDAGSLDASRFALAPATLKEVLAGSFRVPGNVEPGPYSIDVACANGKKATGEIEVEAAGTTGKDGAATRTTPTPDGSDDRSPADTGDSSAYDSSTYDSTADSPTADSPAADPGDGSPGYDSTGLDETEAAGSALVPDSPTAPGRGTSSERPIPSGHESSGTHDSSTGRDSSSDQETPSGHRTSAAPTAPTGHVRTGVGGSVGPDTTQIAAGAGVLAATAVGGAWLLRRRASGTRDDS